MVVQDAGKGLTRKVQKLSNSDAINALGSGTQMGGGKVDRHVVDDSEL